MYVITWMHPDATARQCQKESVTEAFCIAKDLIDKGTRGVEIHVAENDTIIRGAAILDICDALRDVSTE